MPLPFALVARFFCVLMLLSSGVSFAGQPWDITSLCSPPATFPAPEVIPKEGVRTLYFQGLPYQGKPTKVFAFYGLPSTAKADSKVPGIILIHGAGASAEEEWVRLWMNRGYAAIAIDNEGNLPLGNANQWRRAPEGGPQRSDTADLAKPYTDQWMYHAVANVILANSLLRSFPEVDPERIGLTGISWGGVIVAAASGVDSRLKFVVPVYGCGHISDNVDDGSLLVRRGAPVELIEAWRRQWDPANFLPQARMPILWVTGTNDFAFTMRAWQLSYRAAPGSRTLSLHVRMPHGMGPGETSPEIAVFADSIVKEGTPLAKVNFPIRKGNAVSVSYESKVPIINAELNFTKDVGIWQKRYWDSVPASVAHDKIFALLPEGVTAYYFSLVDARGLTVTSEHEEHPNSVQSFKNPSSRVTQ